MADLTVKITSPVPNAEAGRSISVRGTLSWDGLDVATIAVKVRFGENAEPRAATKIGNSWENWRCTGNAPGGSAGGGLLTITAIATARTRPPPNDPGPPDDIGAENSVVVRLESTPPVLSIDPYESEVTPPSLPYRVTLSGSAQDAASAVRIVQYQIKDLPFAPADAVVNDWSRWQKTLDLAAGEHLIRFEALDRLGNTARQEVNISVRIPFEPAEPGLAFAPVTYLQELISFAERWITVEGGSAGPNPQDLASRFFQPFDRLTQLEFSSQATRQLYQSRIAVEVLRRRLRQMNEPLAPATEQSFRRAAHEALLLQLDTSYEELRAARIADETTRRALAERLGFDLETARPDRLDRISLSPDEITEAQLEELFGFEGTMQDDPLHPVNAAAEVLAWRLAAVRNRWVVEDSRTSGRTTAPPPIIDPDMIGEAHLHTTTPGDRVYDLWRGRKRWLDEKMREAKAARPQGFEHVIRTFIGDIDIAALAAQDADGVDITPALDALALELAAFRFLARCSELAAAGALMDTEWQDVLDIVVQVQKKRRHEEWRQEESGLAISPEYFRLPDQAEPSPRPDLTVSHWRIRPPVYSEWRRTVAVRIRQLRNAEKTYQSALDAAQAQALPILRDLLIEAVASPETPGIPAAADRLSRELLIDLRAHQAQKTTRVNQGIETLLGALFSVRAGRLATGSTQANWSIQLEPDFDKEWQWMAAFRSWRAAMTVFAYPENQLYPNLFVKEPPYLDPTQAFRGPEGLIAKLRDAVRMTPARSRQLAQEYLDAVRAELGNALPPRLHENTFTITDEIDNLAARKEEVRILFGTVPNPREIPNYLREIFWLVPIALALQLQRTAHYLSALDWFQTVYAFNLPRLNRKIYRGLELEEGIPSVYDRVPEWLLEELNPHIFSGIRQNAYTRFTVQCIARCFMDYGDAEFSQSTAESVGRARTLYETAADLLNLDDVWVETGAVTPFPSNPVRKSMQLHVEANLAKIHQGLNIAGFPTLTPLLSERTVILRPSQYRYEVLVERAKHLVGIAQQVESAFLTALERRDAEAYNLMQAGHDLRVAQATVALQDLKLTEADLRIGMAELREERAEIQSDYFDQRLRDGLNFWEQAGLVGQWMSSATNPASFLDFGQTFSSYERREQDWKLQQSLSRKDVQISRQEIRLAQNQRQMALQEMELAGLQLDHAADVVDFLINKFTNAELYEWMSGILGRVYGYFLQQSTALAQVAQSQLAFERQEPALSVVQSDYWQVTSADSAGGGTNGGGPDRRGLTGSARLLQDIYRLDQYAFETKQLKLQLTQTLSLAQLAPLELQIFRDTGRLIFVTPMEVFDRDFPGHYLRLLRRVRVSMIALVPPTRGLRATLSAPGISRVVTGGDTFETIEVRRFPESVAFTSPQNATGLFELEAEREMLFPFEGMGVDTVWELELPKASNPFDYRAVADVLLTVEYTALSSPIYRQQVIKGLDPDVTAERMFSFREHFADSWYALNNPDAVENAERRMVVNFSTRRDDFPPHLKDLYIEHVTCRVSRRDDFAEELDIKSLSFIPEGGTTPVGGAARTVRGVVSTRRPNGVAWLPMQDKSPVGAWELRLPDTAQTKAWFKDGRIEDLAFMITFGGVTPPWLV